MPAQKEQGLGEERILVVCVDRDNDIGRKAGVKTPVIGEEDNVSAAVKLLLIDPEEADANAMFEAVRIYRSLKQGGKILCQVATIAGSELGGLAADRKLVSEFNDVIREFKPDSLVLVTDGYSDEDILPLLQSRVPVSSVRRVIIRHNRTIEETAAIFSRYLKRVIDDPRYSKIFLGLPGMLLVMLSILSLLAIFIKYNIGAWAWIVGLMIVGIYLIGKGYGLDRKVASAFSKVISPYGLAMVSSLSFGILLMIVGLYYSINQIVSNPGTFPSLSPSGIIVTGLSIILLGRALAYLIERNSKFWRAIALIPTCAWSWRIFDEATKILINPAIFSLDELIASVIVGIIIATVSMPIAHFLGRRYRGFFKEDESESKQGEREGGGS